MTLFVINSVLYNLEPLYFLPSYKLLNDILLKKDNLTHSADILLKYIC